MSKRRELADLSADVVLSRPQVLAKAYRDYHRYSVTLTDDDGPVVQERDVLIGGKVVVVACQRIWLTVTEISSSLLQDASSQANRWPRRHDASAPRRLVLLPASWPNCSPF